MSQETIGKHSNIFLSAQIIEHNISGFNPNFPKIAVFD